LRRGIKKNYRKTKQIEQRDKSKNESKTQLTVLLFLEKSLSPKMA